MPRLVAIAQAIALYCLGANLLPAQGLAHGVATGLGGTDPDSLSLEASLSEDGRIVAFQSYASNLVAGDTNGCSDVFVLDRKTGITTRVSVSSAGVEGNFYSGEPRISANGRFVAFLSEATNLVPDDKNRSADVFVHDLKTGVTQRVSVSSAGFEANRASGHPSISGDGRFVAFSSEASNLVRDDRNSVQDVFIRDRTDQVTMRITAWPAEPDAPSGSPSISTDGRMVAFESRAAAFGHRTKIEPDVFTFELKSRKVTLVSKDASGAPAGGGSPSMSRDGSIVVFESASSLLAADTNPDRDVYAYRVASRDLVLVSVSSEGSSGRGWNSSPDIGLPTYVRGDSTSASVSNDGRTIAFVSQAHGLVAGDTNAPEVYLRDLAACTTRRLNAPDPRVRKGPCFVDTVLGAVDCPVIRAHLCGNGTLVVAGDSGGSRGIYLLDTAPATESVRAEPDRKPEQSLSGR